MNPFSFLHHSIKIGYTDGDMDKEHATRPLSGCTTQKLLNQAILMRWMRIPSSARKHAKS